MVDTDGGGPRRRGALWGVVAALALGAAAAVGVALRTAGGPERDRDASEPVQLPDPAAPQERAMTAPAGVGVSWAWVNPLPRAMPPWYGVDVVGPDLVAMVGHRGQAARYVDSRLFRWDTGTEASLRDVAWIGKGRGIAVGDGGELRLLGADGGEALDAGTDATLRAVAARTRTEALVVGDGGTLLRVTDGRVRRLEPPTDRDLLGVHVRDDEAWIVGAGGTVLRLAGDAVTPERSGARDDLRAVGGCEDGPLYAAGDAGTVLRRTPEGWRSLPQTGSEPWADLACDGERVAIAGRRGGVLLVAGDRSVRLDSGTDEALHGIASSDAGRTWVVGNGGRMAIVRTDHVRMLSSGPRAPLQDVASLAGTLVAVGEWGKILREKDGAMVLADSPTELALAAVVRISDGRLLALGDSGVLVEITWKKASLLEPPSEASWRDAVAAGGEVLAVGTDGTLLRGEPGAAQASRVEDVGHLWGVDGTPEDAVAVGEGGVVLHLDAEGAAVWPCEQRVTWRGVHRGAEVTWAVGDGGVVARVSEDGCEVERRGGEDLYGIGAGPSGRPLAVGRNGAVLARDAAGQWSDLSLDVGGAHLRGVVATDRYVYVVGSGGVLLRHVRL